MYPTEKVSLPNKHLETYQLEKYLINKSLPRDDLNDILPGMYHFNTVKELIDECMDKPAFGLCDIDRKKGSVSRLFGQTIHPENKLAVYPALLAFAQKKDPTKCFSCFQKISVKGNGEFAWYISTTKYLKGPDLFFTINIPLSSMGVLTAKVLTPIAENRFMKQNLDRFDQLTKREKEILASIAIGINNREIAKKLFISCRTVEQHRKNIRRKLEIKSMAELYRYALFCGLEAP